MKKIEKIPCLRFVLRPLLLTAGLFIVAIGLQSCNEEACEEEDKKEIVEFFPLGIGSPESSFEVILSEGSFVDVGCSIINCDIVEVRFSLYGKNNLGGEEELLESRSQIYEINEYTAHEESFLFNTPPNTSYRLVVEADTPGCTRDRQSFTYEYTFETGLGEVLQGIAYVPDVVVVNDLGTFNSRLPTGPTNDFAPPLTFQIVGITPAIGAEYISIPESSDGQLAATNLINAGKGEYKVDVRVTDQLGLTVLLEDAFTFDVWYEVGQIISLSYSPIFDIYPDSPASLTTLAPIVEGVGTLSPYTFSFVEPQPSTSTPDETVMSYLSVDANTGAVTINNIQNLYQYMASTEGTPGVPPFPRTYQFTIGVTNAVNTREAAFIFRANP